MIRARLRTGFTALALLLLPGATGQASLTSPTVLETIDLEFSTRHSPESAINLLAVYGVRAGQLRHSYEIEGQVWTGFFGFRGSDAVAIGREYREAHAAMTKDLLADLGRRP